jgi:hypothetical protein
VYASKISSGPQINGAMRTAEQLTDWELTLLLIEGLTVEQVRAIMQIMHPDRPLPSWMADADRSLKAA